ncbi:Hypothetical protein NTJ_00046 [Nesidiocoris tenuis]|uniref:Uncharacterized protein n=1 Tax=Nesidiocoris tenuis TaxID=355587 RepID=A0ABN7A8M4_9HEMI|nr:Hypothetical protein NTJ_00046 [Nesidiocoris tenuis]
MCTSSHPLRLTTKWGWIQFELHYPNHVHPAFPRCHLPTPIRTKAVVLFCYVQTAAPFIPIAIPIQRNVNNVDGNEREHQEPKTITPLLADTFFP